MHEVRISVLALVGLAGVWLTTTSSMPARPALLGRDIGPEISQLEAHVSAHPEDGQALAELANTYLGQAAPGLAEAALDRAPTEVRELPAVADARARTLWQLGIADAALEVERKALAACETRNCPRTLLGRAQRRERLLAELVRVGLDDPRTNPDLALVAYRRSTREVTLDLR
jgi:hypothetical protein